MAPTVVREEKPPVGGELGVDLVAAIPSWSALGLQNGERGPSVDREYVPELRWPLSVRTYERMQTDTQLSGLMRGTTLPIRRYVWGVDPNGAPPAIVDAVCAEFNLQPIDQAWHTFLTGESQPIARANNRFSFDRHLTDAMKALRFGHYYFEKVGSIGDDGLWHLEKLAARAPWTIGQIWVAQNGDLIAIKQAVGLQAPDLEAQRLLPYVFEQDPGDWTGRSMYRSCYREWLLKDRLLRVDLRNHENAGGVFAPVAPENATDADRKVLGEMAVAFRAGGGVALPAGTDPVFIRATGSDVIASINRHDESMAREFLMMFMALGTSSSGGNRALAGSFLDWFALAQEAVAIWARDTFNEGMIEPYVDWNWGDEAYVPRVVFKRPETASPLDQLAAGVNQPQGAPVVAGYQAEDGTVVPVAASRLGGRGQIVVDEDTREAINAAQREWAADQQPARYSRKPTPARAAASDTTVPLPDRPLRREPYAHEVQAAINFEQVDSNWQNTVDQLVADWNNVRAGQIAQLVEAIANADGDLATLASISAAAAGGDLIAARLTAMAHTGASEAIAEATAQGVTAAAHPNLTALTAELTARANALETLLANALSQAAANKAVQLSGGGLTAEDVAAQVRDYLEGLSDAYLSDQFGGALAAAQNGGRLAAMDENGASRYYASELLDTNTCEPCTAVDGTEYSSADAAAQDYPAGGYRDCDGGPRCRGLVVAVYDEAAPSDEGAA